MQKILKKYGFKSLEEAKNECLSHGVDVQAVVRSVQPIAFDSAINALTIGTAFAISYNVNNLLNFEI